MKSVIWRPFTQMELPPKLRHIERTKAAYLYSKDGTAILDGISSWWVTNHGHCEETIAEAISNQSKKLDQVLSANFHHEAAETVVSILNSFLSDNLCRYFFSDNGSTSVEVALKMALQFWKQSGFSKKNRFLSFTHSYHGDTVGAMSVGGEGIFTEPYRDFLFPVLRADHGVYLREGLEAFSDPAIRLIEENHESLAAIILEPLVQGAGGMILWPKEAVQKIVEFATAHKVLVIFDEVMTGFGRTGKMFAYEHIGLEPDILCLSKGLTGGTLPLGLTITTPQVFEGFLSQNKERMFFHGHSFTANAISCAAASASLQLFKDRDYPSIWKRMEAQHRSRAKPLEGHPEVEDIRILGTMAAVELTDKSARGYVSARAGDLSEFALQRGVFLRPLGNVIYTLPPYCVGESDLDLIWDVMIDFVNSRGIEAE